MDAIIGLGAAGCAIAENFSKYPQYEVFKIDEMLHPTANVKNNFIMPSQVTSEAYEENCPDMTSFFSGFDEKTNVIFILGGGGKIVGSSLRILEKIKHCNLSILYITPDITLMGGKRYILNRISFNILQEYARSGLFNSISLVYNPSIEAIMGDLPVKGYFDSINSFISSSIHMVNVFSNRKSIFNNVEEHEEHHRISTYGVVDPVTGEEKMFFPLNEVRERFYYIGVSKKSLSDGKYFKQLKENMRSKARKEGIKISFQINETDYDDDYAYFVAYTDQIQDERSINNI
jgi:hypothetical protein